MDCIIYLNGLSGFADWREGEGMVPREQQVSVCMRACSSFAQAAGTCPYRSHKWNCVGKWSCMRPHACLLLPWPSSEQATTQYWAEAWGWGHLIYLTYLYRSIYLLIYLSIGKERTLWRISIDSPQRSSL